MKAERPLSTEKINKYVPGIYLFKPDFKNTVKKSLTALGAGLGAGWIE